MPITLGIVIPDTKYRRLVGDAGNPASYPHRVIVQVIHGLHASDLVRPEPNADLLTPYLEAAKALEVRGADIVGTTCGFLSPLQEKIAAALSIPFVSSSLLQLPLIHNIIRRRVGVITASDEALTRAYLEAAGIEQSTPLSILGLQRCPQFADAILNDSGELSLGELEQVVLEAAAKLLEQSPDIGAILLECHNLPPFSAAVRERTRRPVFDVLGLLSWIAMSRDSARFDQRETPTAPSRSS